MKNQIKLMLLVTAMFIATNSSAQKFFIRFADKAGSVYSVSNPGAFLSAKSIARRTGQSIPVTSQDLPVNQNYIDGVAAQGAVVFTKSKWFNGVTVQCDSATLATILTLPYVVNATKVNRQVKNTGTSKFDTGEPLAKKSTFLTTSFDYGFAFNQIHLMNGEYLHQNGFSGEGMLIAILDAGFYNVDLLPAFDSLRNRSGIIGTWDFVENNSLVYEDDTHGMEVLSTIAGNVPGELVGTAPHANFWLLRTEDVFTENVIEEYNWNAGAEFADSAGADVITSSLGYTDFDDTLASHTYADMNGHTCPSSIAADIAVSKGILVLTSAGNSGNNSWHFLSAPSDGDSVLAVGAVDADGNYVSFSSYGPSSDGDVKPNVAAKGAGSTIADPSGTIGSGSGTSFSCPILAGAAACLLQAHPNRLVMEVKNAIEKSANYYLTPTDTLGYGIPNFASAHFILNNIENPDGFNPFLVYPNPIFEQLNIQLFSKTNTKIDAVLFDFLGKAVSNVSTDIFGGTYQTVQLNVPSGLACGMYFVRVELGDKVFIEKVVKR